ncbi:hypothetical protein R1flu_026648 [Riccia fluitans]|uniref:Uncharacterized protein n=1 Tax=Riccia fluitans TaxID=41844 RepID=A0ABD1XGI8_9MARC
MRSALGFIFLGSTAVADMNEEGVGDATILLHGSCQILESGTSDQGYAAWAKRNTRIGGIGIVSIHALSKHHKRPAAWKWLLQLIETGRWIICGDFDMVEVPMDTMCSSSILRGSEKKCWKQCACQADLVDAWWIAAQSLGPVFSRHALRLDKLDQSRLDRFYISEH